MNRRGQTAGTSGRALLPALLCGAFFSCGCVAGVFFSAFMSPGDSSWEVLTSLRDGALTPEQGQYLTLFLRWHLPVFVMSFCPLGPGLIPVFCLCRGFTFSYALAALLRVTGRGGLSAALRIFAPQAAFGLFFFLGACFNGACMSARLFSHLRHGAGERPFDLKRVALSIIFTSVPAVYAWLTCIF